jgi:hypothetical protein
VPKLAKVGSMSNASRVGNVTLGLNRTAFVDRLIYRYTTEVIT